MFQQFTLECPQIYISGKYYENCVDATFPWSDFASSGQTNKVTERISIVGISSTPDANAFSGKIYCIS